MPILGPDRELSPAWDDQSVVSQRPGDPCSSVDRFLGRRGVDEEEAGALDDELQRFPRRDRDRPLRLGVGRSDIAQLRHDERSVPGTRVCQPPEGAVAT